ncbi:hypothetical protein COS31_01310 [Candidatus Roizmanbacteria bacterium CG02_land_8_20_14_3_00_36_15]|uniref:UDP-N-acetyl-alpha-D-muramoyl-L-alanyl-L-glutamate epimerase n=2 Tax=Candidatus Roizmaniibacteriota TaxID=1752723 RepID=A0A2M8KKG5_9BACT|nr:MAG: hypothetical protein COS51_00815 [Candidatus Roizmanbacteria bacterium CG03_land_8_20_14_0_80_36_21]PIV38085.1 MAG: hypothetical protein COS31_01310 [Candidatus Roizmanbacteria bacterium CG02_land_8_20_14_3_00_36_15]PIY70072.1 MAG: hypothetical protein COY89_03085 [Candidatus Roizmanbacteria bacterium CG_4_10_14_0_8_um_filter_36_36]PJA52679.1 MAG: hypothetical protein CO166_04715 [Candidatus Roizmanbacteria bacterium CG_4_9_14_3_um_filter_36_11]PJC82025.1 MAG: hypothetical protein CO007
MSIKAELFEFGDYCLSTQKNRVEFNYQVIFSNRKRVAFGETITLPDQFSLSPSAEKVFNKCLQSLHLILGISYWKLFIPKKIKIKSFSLTKQQALFWNQVYTKGLGEFFYQNRIKNFTSLVDFPFKTGLVVNSSSLLRKNRSLVAVGGGKDSIVSLELLKKNGLPITGVVVETEKHYLFISKVAQQANINLLTIKRSLDSKTISLNKTDKVYKGHLPISAIYAFFDLLAAVVYDYRYLIFSNERSSNEGNLSYQGTVINHQWSKSSEFETLFNDYVKNYITPDIKYFSLLRPWHELRIAQEFSRHPKYWSVFSSCNRNFSISHTPPKNRWCGRCPKCASIFLLLAPFIPKNKLVSIFGKNLFNNQRLLDTYRGLLGLTKTKPFECVGTVDETRLALYLIWQKKVYQTSTIIRLFEKEILCALVNPPLLQQNVLKTGDLNNIPKNFKLIFQP